jgi:hypothetical protein
MMEAGHSEWYDAGVRVGNYLRALKVTNAARIEEIVLHILAHATLREREHPELRPAVLAVEELRAATERWLAQALPSRERVNVADYLSLLVVHAPESWPATFLAEPIPAELRRALQLSGVRAAPELQVSSMVPEPFDNPLLGSLPLRDALAMLARSLQMAKKSATATLPAKSPPPAAWPQ